MHSLQPSAKVRFTDSCDQLVSSRFQLVGKQLVLEVAKGGLAKGCLVLAQNSEDRTSHVVEANLFKNN